MTSLCSAERRGNCCFGGLSVGTQVLRVALQFSAALVLCLLLRMCVFCICVSCFCCYFALNREGQPVTKESLLVGVFMVCADALCATLCGLSDVAAFVETQRTYGA